MSDILCGYCQDTVSQRDRYWYFGKKNYPLYLHRSCGVKAHEQGESVWTFHNFSNHAIFTLYGMQSNLSCRL